MNTSTRQVRSLTTSAITTAKREHQWRRRGINWCCEGIITLQICAECSCRVLPVEERNMSPALVLEYRILRPTIAFWSVRVTKLTYFSVCPVPVRAVFQAFISIFGKIMNNLEGIKIYFNSELTLRSFVHVCHWFLLTFMKELVNVSSQTTCFLQIREIRD